MTRGLRDSTKVRREHQEAKPIRKRVRIENTVGRQTMDHKDFRILGLPVSPTFRGPALPASEETRGKVEAILREAGVLQAREADQSTSTM